MNEFKYLPKKTAKKITNLIENILITMGILTGILIGYIYYKGFFIFKILYFKNIPYDLQYSLSDPFYQGIILKIQAVAILSLLILFSLYFYLYEDEIKEKLDKPLFKQKE